jgi:transposase
MVYDMRTVCMSAQDALRAGVCRRLLDGKLAESEAARRLDLSVRQVRRLKVRVREAGDAGVVHRSRGRPSPRKLAAEVRTEVEQLYRETYSGWNMQHFSERLASDHAIHMSREALRRILMDEAARPRHQRGKHHTSRERRSREGELLQWDTSIHRWLGEDGESVVLIAVVDDATSKILWAEFFEHDGTLENLAVLRSIVRKHGLFTSLYADRSTKFFLTPEQRLAARESGRKEYTQFGRVARDLGIAMIPAGSPQAKGRIERSFRTHQDRLVKELALLGIKTRQEANRYLRKTFIKNYNQRFGVAPARPDAAWLKIKPLDEANLFCLKETRVVQNDLTIAVNGERWQLKGRVRSGETVELRTRLNGTVHVYKKDKELAWKRVTREQRIAASD